MAENSEGFDDMVTNALLAKQVASGLSATTRLIQSLAADIRENSISVATLKAEVSSMKEDVKSLSEILLKEDRGNKPVLTRLALLEQISVDMGRSLDKMEITSEGIKTKIQTLNQEVALRKIEVEDSRETKKGKLQIIIAIITGIVAVIAAILSALY